MKRRRWKPARSPRRCGDEILLRRGGESGAATTEGRRRKEMATKDASRQKEENVGPQPGRAQRKDVAELGWTYAGKEIGMEE